jgi:glutamate-ammonia-ligase adenylyltransferase
MLTSAVAAARDLGHKLAAMRQTWARLLLSIALEDIAEKISVNEAKRRQTLLAEATIDTALRIVRDDLSIKHNAKIGHLSLAVLALGKLGGRGLDYFSDLDLILVYDDTQTVPAGVTHAEFYGRAVELFVTALSAMTRDGNLYRVDLRLRPYGSKGLSSISGAAFLEYIRETAEIWEMLAFVKLRVVGGDIDLGQRVERETRLVIHQRAAAADQAELLNETMRVRKALEKQRLRSRRPNEIDIKYGSGGMLDVYFAMRYLQLRDNIPDHEENRSTSSPGDHPALPAEHGRHRHQDGPGVHAGKRLLRERSGWRTRQPAL